MIRGTINSSQRLIVFFHKFDGMLCCPVKVIFFSFLGGSRKNSNMLLQQVDCSLHYLVVPTTVVIIHLRPRYGVVPLNKLFR